MPSPGAVGTATQPSASIGSSWCVSFVLIAVSATQYSWKSAPGSTAFTCSEAALMIPLFQA